MSTTTLRIALAQINPTVGDLDGNVALVTATFRAARDRGAELVAFPELTLPGYPPKDLVERAGFVDANLRALERLAPAIVGAAAVVGFVDRAAERPAVGRALWNAAAVIEDGQVTSIHHKALLPTYDVFDEGRWFEPAAAVTVAHVAGHAVGISICEDMWNDPDFWPHRLYRLDPAAELVAQGAELLVNLSASPFELGKRHLRPRMLAAQARKHRRPVAFVNQVGGQDDLLFDGHSLVIDAAGEVRARGRELDEDLVFAAIDLGRGEVAGAAPALAAPVAHGSSPPRRPASATDDAPEEPPASDEAAALAALVMGTRDYARRCGFRSAVVGLSGGIDSALVAAIAARALGADNVLGVSMPSRYSSAGSVDDARALVSRLGIRYESVPIEPAFAALLATLAPALAGRPPGVAQENLQARIRGVILMALSNEFGHLVLSTGNKSELAVGYCTLYGDMNGGLAPLSDVPKTMVYRLAEEVNRHGELIPRATIEKAPSAELRPDQTDQDTLPPYPLLDRVLEGIVERGLDTAQLVAEGFDEPLVRDVMRMVRTNEYKRRQAAPGLKLTTKAFGPGRRIPIAQRWPG